MRESSSEVRLYQRATQPSPLNCENVARWMALYLARELTQETTRTIADRFNLGHTSGINHGTSRLKERSKTDRQLDRRLKLLFDDLTP